MPPSEVQRKLTSILCSDAAGYSRLMGENPEDTLNTLTEYREVFAESIKEYRGRIVNSPGDAILAEFASVLDTVACAVDIQQELGERNQKLPENRRMDFRIGINLGDVLVREGDIFGDGVNVAARLESLAKPGGICISGKAHEEVKKRLPFQFEFMGEQKVKNIADPVRTYRVVIKPGDLSSRAVHMERLRKFAARRGIKAAIGLIAAVLLAGGGWTAWEFFQQTEETEGSRILKFLETGKRFPVSTLPIKDTSGDPEENTFRDGITGMEFVWVSGGTFEMGCGPWNGGECEDEEKPVRPARLDGFWMARHEVTVDQYLMFFQETSGNLPVWLDETSLYHYKKGSDDHYRKLGDALSNGNYPIVGVSWHDATAFTRWLSSKTGQTYRLPSETEWEYACRGGGLPIKYAWGNGDPRVDGKNAANIADQSVRADFPHLQVWDAYDDGYTYTAPVGSFAPNPLGLYDMTGNVWEWVLDNYDDQAYRKSGADNPIFVSGSTSHGIRGGSWDDTADLRCSVRDGDIATNRDNNEGFRVLRNR